MKGFAFGKYYPFHNGHCALMRFALSHCDHLTVIVCAGHTEKLSGSVRAAWISETFREAPVDVIVFEYNEHELPNTSVPSVHASQAWAKQFAALVPECEVLVTSEAYGPMVAEAMGIQHRFFDEQRVQHPVSGTALRNDLARHWNHLPPAVKEFFVTKVSIGGTESTGKTVLSQQLAAHYRCTLVEETGRELIPDSNSFTKEDLQRVAETHAVRLYSAERGNYHLVIADTDVFITQSYSRYALGEELVCSTEVLQCNRFDLHLYLCNDVQFVQDGTRYPEARRNELDRSHRESYQRAGIKLHELSGSWERKLEDAKKYIDEAVSRKLGYFRP